MGSHLSEAIISKYLEKKLTANELLAVDDHLLECGDCAESIASAVGDRALAQTIDLETFPTHLSFESLESIANGNIDAVEKEIAEVHLSRCEACSDSLNELTVLREELGSREVSGVKTATEIKTWQNVKAFFNPAYLIPAFGLLLVGAFGMWWIASRGGSTIEQAAVPTVNEDQIPANGSSTAPEAANSEQPANVASEQPVIASLNDGRTKIELLSDGRITGLASPQFEAQVRNALTKQELNIPADARQLGKTPGVLMGGGSDGVPFALASPVGKTIEPSSPRFAWKPLAGADSYRVEVFDENFNRVAESPQLKTTTWTIRQPLRRGRVYGWQVTATKDGAEIKSPVRPAPDARFKVIDAESSNAIAAARKQGGSHLVLGILYAEAGMLPEAEKEFAALLHANPDSSVVRSLLQKVRSLH